MIRDSIALTTAADGSCTAYGQVIQGVGKLYAIEYQPGSIATGATVTVTCESSSSKPLLTKASAGTANSWYYPRDLVHAVADGAALTGTSGGDRDCPILFGKVKVVIASGGNATSGTLIVYYE